MSFLRQVTLSLGFILPAMGSDSALIASLSGHVTGQVRQGKPALVSYLDWLPTGTRLQTSAKSSVTVLLPNGRRFELGSSARATVGPAGLYDVTGPAHELDPLPPIPKPAPLEIATDSVAVTRFRGGDKIAGLCPRGGMSALPGSVKLTFQQVSGAGTYHIILEDADGERLLDVRTESTELMAPPLQPGSRYSWRVSAAGAAGVIAEEEASFITLSEEQAKAREFFSDRLRRSMEPVTGLALLAEIDFESGLVKEARDGFQAALQLKPQDAVIKRNLDQVEAALRGK